MTFTISQLLESTEKVKGYGAENTFSKKQFGAIYAYNKVVTPKAMNSIIEVSMMIKGATEMVKTRRGNKPVAHKVLVAITGVKQYILTKEELVSRMRLKYPELRLDPNKAYTDAERITLDNDVIARALDIDRKPFENAIVMQTNTDEFTVIEDKIRDDSTVHVWCSCSSYYWVFQYYNEQKDVNLERPGRKMQGTYKHKSKKGEEMFRSGTPMRNPNKACGVCKHLMLLLALLMDKKTVATTSAESKTVLKEYHLNINRFKKVKRLSQSEYNTLIKNFDKDRRKVLEQRKSNFLPIISPTNKR